MNNTTFNDYFNNKNINENNSFNNISDCTNYVNSSVDFDGAKYRTKNEFVINNADILKVNKNGNYTFNYVLNTQTNGHIMDNVNLFGDNITCNMVIGGTPYDGLRKRNLLYLSCYHEQTIVFTFKTKPKNGDIFGIEYDLYILNEKTIRELSDSKNHRILDDKSIYHNGLCLTNITIP